MILELAIAFSLHRGHEEHPGADRWFSADKAKHFFVSSFVQSVAFSGLRSTGLDRRASLVGATVFSAAIGVGKELDDRRRGGVVSARDLVWDAAGISAASVLLRRTAP